MGRLLVVCWLVAAVGVGGTRIRRSGRLSMGHLRGDVVAAVLTGTFVWLVIVVAI